LPTITSTDGTRIAYDREGQGPPVLLVDGALCYRGMGPMRPIAAALRSRFTVYTYDRRGRGESGDHPRWAVEREIEDIEALTREAGGASLFGVSSGAALALEAANRGVAVERLALYEAPFIVDDTRPPLPDGFVEGVRARLAAGRRGDAVRQFMKLVGVPSFFVALMRFMPSWSRLEAVAHTLPYDLSVVAEHQTGRPLSPDRWAAVGVPTLVMDGGKSPAWMRNAMRQLADVVPGAGYRTLRGQTHMVSAKVLAPVLADFFAGASGVDLLA